MLLSSHLLSAGTYSTAFLTVVPDAQDTFWGDIPYVLPTRNLLNQRYLTTHSATSNSNHCQNFIRCRKAYASEPSLVSTNLPNHLTCSSFCPAVILYFQKSKPEYYQRVATISVHLWGNMSPKCSSYFVLFQYDEWPCFLPTYWQFVYCSVPASWADLTLWRSSHTPSQVFLDN